jgi:hypothetical protein
MTTNNTLPESCKWKLILHYDVEDAYFEITNGKIIIAASEESIGWETFEEAEVAAQKIVDALNQSDIEFHSENPLEIQLHIESEEWKAKYNEAIEKIKRMELFEVNVQAGMPENEASFQAGYTCGHDAADQKWKVKYDELKAQSGAVWVKGEYDWLYDQLKAEPEKNIVAYIDYSFSTEGLTETLRLFGEAQWSLSAVDTVMDWVWMWTNNDSFCFAWKKTSNGWMNQEQLIGREANTSN